MKVFTVFDDFSKEAIKILNDGGIQVDVLPKGKARPAGEELKKIIEDYDGVIISTAQKVSEDMLSGTDGKKIIATASIGTDHIKVPDVKKDLIKVVNAPVSNRLSVAEHIFGLIIALQKGFINARKVSANGESKAAMAYKPHDLFGKTLGIIGTGGIGFTVIKYAQTFGMNVICYSNDSPERKREIGETFVELDDLLKKSDIVVTTLPYFPSTANLISEEKIALMKDTATFISISHSGIVDVKAAIARARLTPSFKVGIDIEATETYPDFTGKEDNILITPHIAGGTVEARERMFAEVAENIRKTI